jgi:outer membrane protein assembly factor BamB
MRFRAGVVLILHAMGACGCGGPSAAAPAEKEAIVHRPVAAAEERAGEDWPMFLGPRGTGVSAESGYAERWPAAGPPVIWEKSIGTGYSAPSILGERLVVHHRIGREEIVECLRAATGEHLWEFRYESNFRDPYGYNNGPRCSPLLVGDRCFTFGAEGKLLCLNIETGAKVWLRDTMQNFNVPEAFFGVGCTPILEGDKLIVLVGGQPESGVVAFDAATGKTIWAAVGKSTWNGVATGWPAPREYEWTGDEMLVSYSSPIVATIHGKRHLLCLMRQGLVSLDPSDGSTNFRYWFCSRTYESVNAARPVVIDDQILLSAAYRVGSVLLQVAPDGKSLQEVWKDERNLLAHWSTPIHVDGTIYGFSGRHEEEGELRCLDLETGNVVWQTNGFAGDTSELAQDRATGRVINRATGETIPFPFYGRGSKTQVEDKFIVLGERGTLALVKVNPTRWEELSRTSYEQISYPAWTAPVLSRKRLYLRDEDSLLCLDLAPSDLPQPKTEDQTP